MLGYDARTSNALVWKDFVFFFLSQIVGSVLVFLICQCPSAHGIDYRVFFMLFQTRNQFVYITSNVKSRPGVLWFMSIGLTLFNNSWFYEMRFVCHRSLRRQLESFQVLLHTYILSFSLVTDYGTLYFFCLNEPRTSKALNYGRSHFISRGSLKAPLGNVSRYVTYDKRSFPTDSPTRI